MQWLHKMASAGPVRVLLAVVFLILAPSTIISYAQNLAGAQATAEAQLHAIGVYEGHIHKGGKVNVVVTVTDRPVILLLTAYESVEWHVETAQGVRIEKVILSGYHKQAVTGLPSGIPVNTTSYDEGSATYFYAYKAGQDLAEKARKVSGLEPKTFQGQYRGEAFVIDGMRTFGLPATEPRRPLETVQKPSRSFQETTEYPTTTGAGPIDGEMIEKYQTVAVLPFPDASGAPGSGSTVAGIIMAQLTSKGFTVVDRMRLEKLFEEQKIQLSHSDERTNQLKVGRLSGAAAVVVGEINQWPATRFSALDRPSPGGASVALSLRLLDVETGTVLFSGEGHFTQPSALSTQSAATMILRGLVTRLAVKGGLVSSGRAGYSWDRQVRSGATIYIVREFEPTSPAYDAGLRSGDVIRSCNGSSSSTWKTFWQSMRACQVEAGQTLALEVERGGKSLTFSVPVADRFLSTKER